MLLVRSTHALIAALAVSIPVFLYNGTLFSWHPTLMAVGFLGLMSEGIMTAVSFRGLDGQERVLAIRRHLMWQITATFCVLGGFYAIYQNKVNLGKHHFRTIHARTGLGTILLAIVAPVGGLCSYRVLGVLAHFPEAWQPGVKRAHRMVGMVMWLLALVAIQLALPHKSVWRGTLSTLWQAGVAGLAAAMAALHLRGPPPQAVGLPTAARQPLTHRETSFSHWAKRHGARRG